MPHLDDRIAKFWTVTPDGTLSASWEGLSEPNAPRRAPDERVVVPKGDLDAPTAFNQPRSQP